MLEFGSPIHFRQNVMVKPSRFFLNLFQAEVAVGTYPSTPTDYNWIQDQCNRPLSGDLSDCTLIAVVSDDCGCSSLKIVNRNTGAESTYKINVEDSGCLTILYNELYFLVIIDQRTKAVTLKRSARFESEGSAIIFALNDEGDVCLCSGDRHGSVEYAVVIRNEVRVLTFLYSIR